MLNLYAVYTTTRRDNKEIDTRFIGEIITDKPNNHTDILTWNNLDDYIFHHGLAVPFNCFNFKNDRIISFFNFHLFKKETWDIRKSKYPELNITVEYEYVEIKHWSIERITKYWDGEKASQFLKEHLFLFSLLLQADKVKVKHPKRMINNCFNLLNFELML